MSRVLPLLAIVCLAFAPVPLPKRERGPTPPDPTLAGSWAGQNPMRISAAHLRYEKISYRLVVDPAAQPAAFDLFFIGEGQPYYLGIYRVEGDTLTISYNLASNGRPTAFRGPGAGALTEVYKRK